MSTANDSRRERSAGLLLIGAALAAMLIANSPLASDYRAVLHLHAGPLSIEQWVADGAMALFFLLVGLEVKREWFEGQLATAASRRLPLIAAAAGMAVPALLYLAVVGGEAALHRGWAIPAATDIAFALGVLALLGSRAPPAVKLLLVTIAVIDDVGAVAIIAVAYTRDLDLAALAAAAAIVAAMVGMGRLSVRRLWPFLIGFALLWAALLKSGVHPTIAGVLAALTVPLGRSEARSPLRRLEHRLHPWVMFGVVPLFALVSAGVFVGGADGVSRLPLAIVAGLAIGKQAGVFGAVWLSDRTGVARKPASLSWPQVHGAALLCGVGFTMSLFITALAFPGEAALIDEAKLGILAGSGVSGLAGYLLLRATAPTTGSDDEREQVDDVFASDEEDGGQGRRWDPEIPDRKRHSYRRLIAR